MTSMITATFKTRPAAEQALRNLDAHGITDEQISLIITDETRGKSFNMETSSRVDEGLAAGATAGGMVGVVLGALATASAIAIPGLNVVVAGTFVSAMAGLGAGAATGGLVGALVGAGMTEHEAKLYEDEVKNGSIFLAIEANDNDDKDEIENLLKREDAYNIAA